MDVSLLENIENLGSLGDKVSVKAGFARNYLVPQGKAQMATAENLAAFEARRAELEKAAAEAKAEAEKRQATIAELSVLEITARVGSEDKLFGSIGVADVVDVVTAAGVEIEKKEVRMPEGPIRTTGEHSVDIHLYTDVDVSITLNVIGQE